MTDKLCCPECGVHVDEHPKGLCLDAWAAKDVMGLPVKFHTDNPNNEKYFYLDIIGRDGICMDVEKYSERIAAAWELVEKFRDDPLSHRTATSFVDAIADATDANQDDFMADVYNLMMGLTPLTITRAAIKATAPHG